MANTNYKIVSPNGSHVYFTITGTPIVNENNQPKVVGGTLYGSRTADLDNGSVMEGVTKGHQGEYQQGHTVENLSHTDKAVAAGAFASNLAGGVIRRVTASLGGIANTVLRSGASDFGHRTGVHGRQYYRTVRTATAIRANDWNPNNGSFDTAPGVFDDTANIGQDNAANPTRAIPGELVYKEPKPLPVQDDYSSKTG